MITGVHALFFSEDPDATRSFLRDVLEFPHVDDGDGWLIFQLPAGEAGVHPAMGPGTAGQHAVSFMCDDVAATRQVLQDKGAEFLDDVTGREYGQVTHFSLPGVGTVELYQPTHAIAKDLPR